MNDFDAAASLDRRTFLRFLAGAGIGGVALGACSPRTGTSAAGRSLALGSFGNRIGLQLYTVRDLLQQDFEDTLAQVAGVGYREVEFAGYYQRTPEQVRALLDRLGLTAPSTHVNVNALRQDFDGQLRTARVIGHSYLTVPAYRPGQGEDPVSAWRAAATEFNTFGRRCRDEGIRFAYHNHAWEFQSLPGGTTPFDILVGETDPELVDFELDLYWAVHGGRDPIRLFERYPGRFTMWHVKDMRDPQGGKEMVPVGEGTIDFAEIFAQASRSGMRHFFVEHDNAGETVGSLESIRTSIRHLQRLLA